MFVNSWILVDLDDKTFIGQFVCNCTPKTESFSSRARRLVPGTTWSMKCVATKAFAFETSSSAFPKLLLFLPQSSMGVSLMSEQEKSVYRVPVYLQQF